MRHSPSWFRETLTYTRWPQAPNAHGPFGKDQLTPAERRSLRGIPLFINVQSASAVREAHALGGRALAYISFLDTYVHTAGFENGTARVPWDPRRPQMLLLDDRGQFRNTPMDSSHRMWRYLICSNTAEYVAMALDMVRRQMDEGVDGLFIDNSNARRPCYGHGAPVGYSKRYRQVIAGIPDWPQPQVAAKTPPEQLYRRGIEPHYHTDIPGIGELPRHRHLYPGRSHDYAYERLLEAVARVVRGYGKDKAVVVNGCRGNRIADGVMLESYLYSWAWHGPQRDWLQRTGEGVQWRAFVAKGGRPLALSYVGRSDREPIADAFHAAATAFVNGFLWSDYHTCADARADALRRLRLGKRLTAPAMPGEIKYACFEGGLVAANQGTRRRAVEVPLPGRFHAGHLRDLMTGDTIARGGNSVRVVLPPRSGWIAVAQ